ncbi:MAG: hypothetical protein ABFC77_12305 [Thermoguttaceae bacterium]
MKWQLGRSEHVFFVISIVMMAIPFVLGPKAWDHDQYGYPVRYPALSAFIYYLAAALLGSFSGYRSIISFLVLRRWRHRHDDDVRLNRHGRKK